MNKDIFISENSRKSFLFFLTIFNKFFFDFIIRKTFEINYLEIKVF